VSTSAVLSLLDSLSVGRPSLDKPVGDSYVDFIPDLNLLDRLQDET